MTKNYERRHPFYYGAILGFCELIVTHPIETIKVLKQSNTLSNFRIRNMYNGFLPALNLNLSKHTVRFSIFQQFKGNSDEYLRNFCAGLFSGFMDSTLCGPLEYIKTRQQSNNEGIKKCISSIYKERGLVGFYNGYIPLLARQCINQSINFSCYNLIRNKVLKKDEEIKLYKVMIAGMISGGLGPIINNPFDVIKTRMSNPLFKYNSIYHCLRSILKHHGFFYFYNGATLRICKVGIGQGVCFVMLENLIKYDI